MKLVFCGTPEFAVPSLQALLDAGHEIPLVLTQPDRPAGRKMELQIPPVKRVALANNLPIFQPDKILNNNELHEKLKTIAPDAIIVVAYGRIIPDWMLALPDLGCVNVHGSLLPKYRGAAPVQWAVANGEAETGVTTMLLDSGLDTGDMLLKVKFPIGPTQTSIELFPQLAHIGAKALVDTLSGLASGAVQPERQCADEATLAPILTREDGLLSLAARSAKKVYDRWRGFSPWPGAWGQFRGKRFLVHSMSFVENSPAIAPGGLACTEAGLFAGAADGRSIRLDEVQLEGKPRMLGPQFARDFQLKAGECVE